MGFSRVTTFSVGLVASTTILLSSQAVAESSRSTPFLRTSRNNKIDNHDVLDESSSSLDLDTLIYDQFEVNRRLHGPPHHHHSSSGSNWTGCFGYDQDDLSENWKGSGNAPDCSYTTSSGGSGGSSSGGSSGGSSSGGSSNGGGGNGDDGGGGGGGNNGGDNDGGNDGGGNRADEDGANVDAYNVCLDGEDDDGTDCYNPADDFNIRQCQTYENLWLWDLSLTCEDMETYEGCQCKWAEEFMDMGILSCDDTCPPESECKICSDCLRLAGCSNVKTGASGLFNVSTLAYIIGGAVGIIAVTLTGYALKNNRQIFGLNNESLIDDGPPSGSKPEVWLAPDSGDTASMTTARESVISSVAPSTIASSANGSYVSREPPSLLGEPAVEPFPELEYVAPRFSFSPPASDIGFGATVGPDLPLPSGDTGASAAIGAGAALAGAAVAGGVIAGVAGSGSGSTAAAPIPVIAPLPSVEATSSEEEDEEEDEEEEEQLSGAVDDDDNSNDEEESSSDVADAGVEEEEEEEETSSDVADDAVEEEEETPSDVADDTVEEEETPSDVTDADDEEGTPSDDADAVGGSVSGDEYVEISGDDVASDIAADLDDDMAVATGAAVAGAAVAGAAVAGATVSDDDEVMTTSDDEAVLVGDEAAAEEEPTVWLAPA